MNGSANDPEIRERIALSIWKGLVDASVALMEGSEIAQRFDVAFDSDYRLRLRFISRLKQICEGDRRGVKYVQIVINRILRAFDVSPQQRSAQRTPRWPS